MRHQQHKKELQKLDIRNGKLRARATDIAI